ncbi:MAG: hypothetical protein JSS98_17860 [Bacteroidetes bacterium]|nr:hypothetical protein [Bacteroidota bacterium]
MAKEGKSNQFVAIRSMFLSGSIKRMKDIEMLYPTLVAKTLGINHSRYIQKLYKPEEFSIKQIIAMSVILELNPQMILDVILKQVGTQAKSGKKKTVT